MLSVVLQQAKIAEAITTRYSYEVESSSARASVEPESKEQVQNQRVTPR